MNCLVRWPRWVTVPVAVVVVAGLVSILYPGGVVAAYEDVRDASVLTEQMRESRQAEQQRSADAITLHDRMSCKEELLGQLLRGETSLTAVTDRFVELHESDELWLSAQRVQFGDRPTDELAACSVLEYVRPRIAADAQHTSPVWARLYAEYCQRFGHPAPRAE